MLARCVRRAPSAVHSSYTQLNLNGYRAGPPDKAKRMAASSATGYKLLLYEYVPDILEKRGPHREGHLAAATTLVDAGKCVLGGAAGDPVSQGVFVFKGMSDEDVKRFVGEDPYVKNGLVNSWKVLPYMVAVGSAHQME